MASDGALWLVGRSVSPCCSTQGRVEGVTADATYHGHVATPTAPQRHRLSRVLLLFALLAAVFAMHSLDATHATAASTTSITAPTAMTMPMPGMDMPMPATPDHAADQACHDLAHMAGGCLALLVAAIALGGLAPRRPASTEAEPRHRGAPTARPARRSPPRAFPPSRTLLSVCRT
jgi:hypothetical protein